MPSLFDSIKNFFKGSAAVVESPKIDETKVASSVEEAVVASAPSSDTLSDSGYPCQ